MDRPADLATSLRELAERYFRALDRADLDALARCFTEDAVTVYLGGDWRLTGRHAIVDRFRAYRRTSGLSSSIHLVGTQAFTVGGAGAAGHVLAIAHLEFADRIVVRGLSYDDTYVLVDGSWLIRERRQKPLWQYEISCSPVGLPAGPGRT
ncbi:MAG: hypothetical protein ABS81_05285 [Pseudonocardia sp. SCN 72-86]|nr:MAG: hypothetical protein ABS81_05285 [Pseudonocardia sp. SCN 72-86]